MVHSICQDLLTEPTNKIKSLLKGIHGNEEIVSKTIQKITIISANYHVTLRTISSVMD